MGNPRGQEEGKVRDVSEAVCGPYLFRMTKMVGFRSGGSALPGAGGGSVFFSCVFVCFFIFFPPGDLLKYYHRVGEAFLWHSRSRVFSIMAERISPF